MGIAFVHGRASAAELSSSMKPSLASCTNLIKTYSDSGAILAARRLFDEMPERDVVVWTAMISGYTSNSQYIDAWGVFRNMLANGVGPNEYTLSSVLKSCKGLERSPAAVHGMAMVLGVDKMAHVGNALLDAYAVKGEGGFRDAVKVFEGMEERNVVAWTTMMAAYARWGNARAAVSMFQRMIQVGAEWSAFTSSTVIHACASIPDLALGKQVHASVVKSGHETNVPVSNAIIDMYCKCSSVTEAKQYFRQMQQRDLITWNTMIAGLSRSESLETFRLLLDMWSQSIEPNCFTFTSVISSCAHLSFLNCGQQAHAAIVRRGFSHNLQITNALIDMYTKCGSILDSVRVFDTAGHRDVISYTSMMIGYGLNGYGQAAVALFEDMIRFGIRPDSVVFIGLLSACSHAGLVEQGLKYFRQMGSEYNLRPDKEVYGCVVDLLGRAGRVEEACELIKRMKVEPDESVWGALLGACKVHGNVEMGRVAAEKILELTSEGAKAKTYVVLANIYAAGSEWGEAREVRRLMKGSGRRKEAGRSWIEVRDEVFSFIAGDRCGSGSVSLACEVLEMLAQHLEGEIDLNEQWTKQ